MTADSQAGAALAPPLLSLLERGSARAKEDAVVLLWLLSEDEANQALLLFTGEAKYLVRNVLNQLALGRGDRA